MHMYRRVKGGDDYILGLDGPTRCKEGLLDCGLDMPTKCKEGLKERG